MSGSDSPFAKRFARSIILCIAILGVSCLGGGWLLLRGIGWLHDNEYLVAYPESPTYARMLEYVDVAASNTAALSPDWTINDFRNRAPPVGRAEVCDIHVEWYPTSLNQLRFIYWSELDCIGGSTGSEVGIAVLVENGGSESRTSTKYVSRSSGSHPDWDSIIAGADSWRLHQ